MANGQKEKEGKDLHKINKLIIHAISWQHECCDSKLLINKQITLRWIKGDK